LATAAAAVIGAVTVLGVPADAQAFCGFYVAPQDGPIYSDAAQVALMREGTRTVISMSNNYKGPASDFAMVVPVPVVLKKEDVKTLPLDTFKKLEALSAPRLVEYWEQDPCYVPPPYAYNLPGSVAKSGGAVPTPPPSPSSYGVKIEAQFKVGEFDILVLSAKESDGLERWLVDNKYKIPAGAAAALAPYIKEQMKFFVAKVDVKKVQMDAQGVATLSPLRFAYESQDFRLPVRLGLLNAKAKQDLIIYLLSKNKRYQAANYPNVFIPTNLDVKDDTRKSFGSFYASLFDEAVSKGNGKGIVTEYSWQSNSCDPCPTPPLQDSDVATLGGDVLFGMGAPPPPTSPTLPSAPGGKPTAGGMPAPRPGPMPPWGGGGGYYGSFSGAILTRLHARYDSTTLSDDIFFSAAEPVVGGCEFVVDDKGNLEKGALPSPSGNNFQARYAIRHPWTGPIKCQNPRRGIWGGPPAGVAGSTAPTAATGLASVPRGSVQYASFVKRGSLDFQVSAAPGITPPPVADAGAAVSIDASDGGVSDAGDASGEGAAAQDASAAPAAVPSVQPASGHGCGCEIPSRTSAGASVLAALGGVLAGAIAVARRRRRR
jgi:hypothetical protein